MALDSFHFGDGVEWQGGRWEEGKEDLGDDGKGGEARSFWTIILSVAQNVMEEMGVCGSADLLGVQI